MFVIELYLYNRHQILQHSIKIVDGIKEVIIANLETFNLKIRLAVELI